MDELIDKHTITLLISQLGLAMVKEVFEAFVPNAEENIHFLQKNWHMEQHKDLRIKSHSLKSSAANLGFMQLSRLAKSLEEHCINHEQHEFNANKDKLDNLSPALKASIDELALMGIARERL
jgi:HPt (histidine-containing phosphotransfer) domain-containing protein